MSLPFHRPCRGFVLFSLPLVLLSSAAAQKMAVPSATPKSDESLVYVPQSDSVRKSRTAYSQAARDWEAKRDRSLVTDISLPKDVIVGRITAEQERTAKMLQGRQAYYESLGKYYDSLGQRMSAAGQIDVEGQKAVTQQGIMMLVEQRQQLETEIVEAAKEPSIQNQLKDQLRNIEKAKKTLEDDALALDRIKQVDAAYEQRRVSAAQAQKNLARTMQSIADSTGDLNRLYDTQFRALKSVAGTPKPKEEVPVVIVVSKPKEPLVPAITDEPRPEKKEIGKLMPVPQNSAADINLNGNWMFRATDKLNDPGIVVVEIHDAAGAIKGHLTMTMAPKSWGASQFDCDFSGPSTLKGDPGAYTFACNTGARMGELQLLPNPANPGLLEVVWTSRGNKSDIRFDQLLTK